MKTIISTLALTLTAAAALAQTNALTSAVQKGLFEEEVNRNFKAAIESYESAVAEFDQQRQLAATAIFRLAENYRRAGRTEEATALYERIVREFADQKELVALSRPHAPETAHVPDDGLLPGEVEEIQTFRALLRTSPDAVNAPDDEGLRPLHRAAGEGRFELARFLIENGATVNFPDRNRMTPLHYAAARGHHGVVELLLKNGAQIDATDAWQATPLSYAVNTGMLVVADYLLKHGAAKGSVQPSSALSSVWALFPRRNTAADCNRPFSLRDGKTVVGSRCRPECPGRSKLHGTSHSRFTECQPVS